MGSSRLAGGCIATALLAACNGSKPAPASDASKPDSLAAVAFKDVTGMVIGADSAMPKCPVTPKFDATLTLTHMSGKLQYRWERSTGVLGPIQEADIPSAAANGSADLAVKPDQWSSAEKGVQLSITNRVHVLAPIEKLSPPVDVQLKCY